jgi:hypothetical protein
MPDEHQPAIPRAIEQVVSRLAELEIVFGEPARTAIPVVRSRLLDAMAARDRGDPNAALAHMSHAMDELARLADRLDPEEAMLMRAVAERFRTALGRGDRAGAQQAAATMFEQSGARERQRP